MKNKLLPLIFGSLLVASTVSAQKCGTYEGSFEAEKHKHPEFYQSLESLNAELDAGNKDALSKMKKLKVENGKKIIPVVVHVIHDFGNENISDASIQGALDILNANMNGQAANFLAKTPDIFASVRGDLNVEFRLAKIDPEGNPTTGIVRVQSELTDQPEPRDVVKSLSYWNSYEYFNIWTLKKFAPQADGNTLLGYAQFPWTGSMSTDGVVLLASQMVSGGTLTHECGHWLGLRHTWGDAVCGDDGVKDTPPAREPNFGVGFSSFPYHVGLSNLGCIADSLNYAGEMFVNYMDYSDDSEVTMFTKGQNVVMNETLDGIYDEETQTTGIGYREYLWSAENVAATGVSDGYLSPLCDQKADFSITTGISSLCAGEQVILKGNKSQFGNGNVSSMLWDFGDGETDNTNTNFLTHNYANVGTYDVSLTVEYNETTEARAANLSDLDLNSASSYDSIITNLIVQGTEQELIAMGATGIVEKQIDSLGIYWGMQDSSFFRGSLEKKTYVAYYNNTCTSTTIKEGYLSVEATSSSNVAGDYQYSFESDNELTSDWNVVSGESESNWSFNHIENDSWKRVEGIASNGSSSIMIDKDNLTLGSDEIISVAYDLSALTSPAIKFSYSGAATNEVLVNELNVYYSDDCGEVWRALGSLTEYEVANAGLYTTNFKPNADEWNDTIMTKNQLKNNNIRFKFEYVTNGAANNFYLDNIRIGESAALMLPNSTTDSRLSVYPNPTNGNANVVLENLVDKHVKVNLVNVLGAEVMNVFDGEVVSNFYSIDNIDLSHLETGVYFMNIESEGNVISTEKLILNK